MVDLDLTEEELKALLGRQIANQPWPSPGSVVTIAADWEGPYPAEEFLRLQAGDQVKVAEVSPGGAYLYGTVVSARGPKRTGWFGGPGCEAVVSVSISVPLGNGSDEDLQLEGYLQPKAEEGKTDGFNGAGSLQDDVEAYVERNGVDEHAAARLRSLPPELQTEIIKNDMTKNIRNPSAALLSRINHVLKDAQYAEAPPPVMSQAEAPSIMIRGSAGPRARQPERSRSPPRMHRSAGYTQTKQEAPSWSPQGIGLEEVENFISRHGLDVPAAEKLRALLPEEQESIVLTDLTNARNPSAVVLSRIDRLHKEAAAEGHRQQVEDYLQRHNIDEEASAMLRALPPDRQQAIIGTEMTNANNCSAVLISRIRGIEAMHIPAGQPAPPASGWRPAARMPRAAPAPSPAEDFIRRWDLDESVANLVRALSLPQLNEVMACNVAQARNPSAMVKSRIRSVTSRPSNAEFSRHQQTVEEYLSRYNVDEAAQAEMRKASVEVQLRVMEQELSNCRNPSAVLGSRIREISRGRR